MTHNLEYISYSDNDRLAMLENRAAELERRIAQATPSGGLPEFHASDHGTVAFPAFAPPHESDAYGDSGRDDPELDDPDYPEEVATGGGYREAAAGLRGGSGERTRSERLINGGRRHVKRGPRRWLAHWRAIAIGAAAFAAGITLITVVLPGRSPGWPASVATVQTEITTACQNPNVVSEPAQVNFACAKDTQQVLWVFSLLDERQQPRLRRQVQWQEGPRADSAGPGRRHRLVAQPAPPVQPGQPDRQPAGSGTGDQQHHRRRHGHRNQWGTRGTAGAREQPSELREVHRFVRADHQARVPSRVCAAGQHRGRSGRPGQRRVLAVDGRRAGAVRDRGRRALPERRQPG